MQLNDYRTGKPFAVNPANIDSGDLDHGGDTHEKMRGRGVKIALCNAATRWYSRVVAAETGGKADDIYQEFVANAVPDAATGSVVKPTVANDRHFKCTTAGTLWRGGGGFPQNPDRRDTGKDLQENQDSPATAKL